MASRTFLLVAILAAGGVGAALLISALDLTTTTAKAANESRDVPTFGTGAKSELLSPATAGPSRAAVQEPEPINVQPPVSEPSPTDMADKPTPAKPAENGDQSLEQKYAGATLGQLLEAESVLGERRDVDRDRILKELVDANRLVELPRAADGTASLPGNKDGSPFSFIMRSEHVNGVNVTKAAVITGEEFPDFRALELEVWWLRNKVHAVKKQAKTQESQSR